MRWNEKVASSLTGVWHQVFEPQLLARHHNNMHHSLSPLAA